LDSGKVGKKVRIERGVHMHPGVDSRYHLLVDQGGMKVPRCQCHEANVARHVRVYRGLFVPDDDPHRSSSMDMSWRLVPIRQVESGELVLASGIWAKNAIGSFPIEVSPDLKLTPGRLAPG